MNAVDPDSRPDLKIHVAQLAPWIQIGCYLRYFVLSLFSLLGAMIMCQSNTILEVYVIAALFLLVIAETKGSKVEQTTIYPNRGVFFYPLQYFFILANCLVILIYIWRLGIEHGNDFLAIGALLGANTDRLTQTDTASAWACFFVASSAAIANTLVLGHEGAHRTENPLFQCWSRIGTMFGQCSFLHTQVVFGHYRWVGTPHDPATPMRGEDFWNFALRSTIGQYAQAWEIEKERLNRMGRSEWEIRRNHVLHGWAGEAIIAVLFLISAGFSGLLALAGIKFIVHFVLSLSHYVMHYGLVRDSSQPCPPNCAWNAFRCGSAWISGGIAPVHSTHHSDGSLAVFNIPIHTHTPRIIGDSLLAGYFLALIPPLWHTIYNNKLMEWDSNFAEESQKALAYSYSLDSQQVMLTKHAQNNLQHHVDKALTAN